jgi:hypothetical protein
MTSPARLAASLRARTVERAREPGASAAAVLRVHHDAIRDARRAGPDRDDMLASFADG